MFSPQASLVVGERKKQVIASLSNIIKTYFTFRYSEKKQSIHITAYGNIPFHLLWWTNAQNKISFSGQIKLLTLLIIQFYVFTDKVNKKC